MVVDIPLAATEGLRAVPKIYGENIHSHGEVIDAANGFSVAGKSFVKVMMDSVISLCLKPMEGVNGEDSLGYAKAVGKGIFRLAAKTNSVAIDVVA